MVQPIISREEVHRYAEACSDDAVAYQPIAARLMREQKRLARFIEQNAKALGANESQVALYMASVCLRVFDCVGGRMDKVPGRDLDAAAARVSAVVESLLPFDDQLPTRVRQIEWRAQPHLLDEILWALYEREDAKEGEEKKGEGEDPGKLDPEKAALLFLTMWPMVEAMSVNWHAPGGYTGEKAE